MRCVMVRTDAGHELRDQETGVVVCGPTWSYGEISRYTRDNKLTIVDRTDESGLAPKGKAAKSKT